MQVGRESPADIVVAVPTVSTRHAMLRLGTKLLL
jgi:pSer/pThr/pTyr-binding forkhead associated (FHA) protein